MSTLHNDKRHRADDDIIGFTDDKYFQDGL